VDAEATLHLILRELDNLRPLGDPKNAARNAEHPISLMHTNHRGRVARGGDVDFDASGGKESVCEADPVMATLRGNKLCLEWAQQHGRQSEQLWEQYKQDWRGRCAKLRLPPQLSPAGGASASAHKDL
jgi:hypothetical protein